MGEISDALARAQEAEKTKRPVEPRETPPLAEERERPHSALMREAADAPPASPPPVSKRSAPPSEGCVSTSSSPSSSSRSSTARADETERTNEVGPSEAVVEADPVVPAPGVASSLSHGLEQADDRTKKRHQISTPRADGWIGRICAVEPEADVSVRFRHLAVRMRSMLDGRRQPSVLVTSSFSGEGKTTVSCNLAIALASISPECRIALVDMDLHRGCVSRTMNYSGQVGIEDVMRGDASLSDACVETEMPALDFYPVCNPVQDAHGLLGGAAGRTLENFHARYDYVICDGPPVLPVPDVPLIAPHVGGCLVVAASGRSRHRAFRETLSLIPRGMTLGVFLNENPGALRSRSYKYYSGSRPEDSDSGVDADGVEEANR
jgi:Mrp family chromosome partitioning ATPase